MTTRLKMDAASSGKDRKSHPAYWCEPLQVIRFMSVPESAYITSMTYEVGILEYEDFPRTEEPVWILGNQYSALYDLDDIKKDVLTRLWFTYRRGFSAIGNTGPESDTGWGCMLRCGQMMLAQALMARHLGRGWRWEEGHIDPTYRKLLQQFEDRKGACYSIHQIASMGVSEGKAVGQWFGPNTVAQVLRKLAVYDSWSSLVVHVAMDNTVIMDDILQLCSGSRQEEHPSSCKCSKDGASNICSHSPRTHAKTNGIDSKHCRKRTKEQTNSDKHSARQWRPLLLIIPLRLGLSEINSVYTSGLKTCLSFKQSVGIIGGKPNHALWFIGHVGNELIYLDPHTTQPVVNLDQGDTDESYHCLYASRMNVNNLDPSIALGFYCGSKEEFTDLCQSIEKFIISHEKTPMFELHQERPHHWPPLEPYKPKSGTGADFTIVDDRQYDTDEEFELL